MKLIETVKDAEWHRGRSNRVGIAASLLAVRDSLLVAHGLPEVDPSHPVQQNRERRLGVVRLGYLLAHAGGRVPIPLPPIAEGPVPPSRPPQECP